MRMMLRAKLNTEMANAALKSGELQKSMQEFMTRVKPEAAYFTISDGCRCCYLVVNIDEPSDQPPLLEGLFQVLGAEIELAPAMNAEDLMKGMAKLKN